MRRLVPIVLAVAGLATVALAVGSESAARQAASSPNASTPVDIEIAVDGTGSMTKAIAQAARDGTHIVDGVTSVLPDTQFAVVVFRDYENPAGEYELLQPMTRDPDRVQAALGRIKTSSNPSPLNGPAESYNLAFQNSYRDDAIAWRPEARKVVVVLGDAEPNGAGAAGLPGCKDQSRDPHGLSTPHELERMRAAHRTLIMVRQLSPKTTVSLRCYQSLAARAFTGGTARDGGSADLASTIIELIQRLYAPVALKHDLGLALPGQRTGYTITLPNPNSFALTVNSLTLVLPTKEFHYVKRTTTGSTTTEPTRAGRTLLWSLDTVLSPREQMRLHLVVQTPHRVGTYLTTATAHVQTANGEALTSRSPIATLHVKRRVHAIGFRFRGQTAAGAVLQGRASSRFGRGAGRLPAVAPARGTLLLHTGQRSLVVLAATKFRLERLATPTQLYAVMRVIGAKGLPGCSKRARAMLLVVDSPLLREDGHSRDVVLLRLPRGCGGTTLRFANGVSAHEAANVVVSAS